MTLLASIKHCNFKHQNCTWIAGGHCEKFDRKLIVKSSIKFDGKPRYKRLNLCARKYPDGLVWGEGKYCDAKEYK